MSCTRVGGQTQKAFCVFIYLLNHVNVFSFQPQLPEKMATIPFIFTVTQEITSRFHSLGTTSGMEGLKLVGCISSSCCICCQKGFQYFWPLILGSDFVLVWEVRSRRKRRGKGKVTSGEGEAAPTEESSRSERRKAQLAQWREKFVQNLESAGLLMEKVSKWISLSLKSTESFSFHLPLNNLSVTSLPFRRKKQMRRKPFIFSKSVLPGMCWYITLKNFALELHCRFARLFIC